MIFLKVFEFEQEGQRLYWKTRQILRKIWREKKFSAVTPHGTRGTCFYSSEPLPLAEHILMSYCPAPSPAYNTLLIMKNCWSYLFSIPLSYFLKSELCHLHQVNPLLPQNRLFFISWIPPSCHTDRGLENLPLKLSIIVIF